MKNRATPKPGSKKYNIEKTEDLNTPKYHSSSDTRHNSELPAIENLNDQPENEMNRTIKEQYIPKPDLGNKRKKNEKQREKIIAR